MSEQKVTIWQLTKSMKKIKPEIKTIIWQELVKWLYFQFKSDHHITFGKIGDYGYKFEEGSQQKIPILFFNSTYLKELCLINKHKSYVLKPLVKINYSAISQHFVDRFGKEEVQYFLEVLFSGIENLLKDNSKNSVQIDLDILGKIFKHKNEVWFEHAIPNPIKPKSISKGGTSVRFYVQKEGANLSMTKTNFFTTKRQGFLPKIQNKVIHQKRIVSKGKQQRRAQEKQSLYQTQKQEIGINRKVSSRVLRSGSLKALPKSQKQSTIGWQMMGAGNDPLKKKHDYAHLTGNVNELMKTKFFQVKSNPVYNIPIIDGFSRTLACPVATQRQNPMVSARIGSNLSVLTQHLQISGEGIKYTPNKSESLSTRIELKKRKDLIGIVSERQEYRLVIGEKISPEEEERLELKRKNFESYKRLFDMIEEKNIVQFKRQVLERVLNQIDKKYESPKIIQQIINEIVDEHIKSNKKSIIQYILLDPTERERLAIYIQYKPMKFYGDQRWKPKQINYTAYFNRGLSILEQSLVKNTNYCIQIQELWLANYEKKLLVVLPKELDEFITVDEFQEKQRHTVKILKDRIISEWVPRLSEIYKDQINAFKRNQRKCEIFFQSMATMLGLQIRTLIEKSFREYLKFIKKYEMKILNPPDTVVYLQKTKNKYEKCFLTVRVSHRKDEIYFMDMMSEIQNKLLSTVSLIREFSELIPRPQNLITKTDKHFLVSMTENDHIFQQIKVEIRRIVKNNLENCQLSLNIFNKYKYVLSEAKVVEQWIYEGNHDRRQYAITFQKYNDLYDQIFMNIPVFIRMNMINVDSSELKNFMLKNIQQIIKNMEKSVYELVMKKNNEIQTELDKMIGMAKSKAKDCKKLVQIETAVDSYRRNDIRKLQLKNADMVKWIGITLYNTFYSVVKDDLKMLSDTAKFLQSIFERLDQEDVIIFEQRKKLQQKAKEDSKYYKAKVQVLSKEIQKIKDYGSKMLKDAALQVLRECRQNLNTCKSLIKDLNERELLLGMDETEKTKLQQLEKQLKPFEQLWFLVRDYYQNSQSWTKDSIFKLNSEDIEVETKKMYKLAVQLSNNNLIRKFAPISIKVIESLLEDIKQFQTNIPLITVFSNPGLKSRHFSELQNLVSYEGEVLSKKSNLYLNKVLSLGFKQYLQQIEVISETASKEFMIEITIKKIRQDWSTVQFEMKKYKETEISVLMGSSLEEIQGFLDDHSMKMITMKGSLYFKTFEQELNELDEWLSYTNQLIDYSIKVQSVWMYLEPVMTSPDILKHLSVEGAKFRVVDENWRQLTKFYSEKLLVTEITKNKKIVSKLKESHNNLEIVLKGLNSYLQSKRLSFPRFFFLSNEELLEILSETKDPTKVQPHLKKCFEGIAKLQFEEDKIILGMYSDEGQFVSFGQRINTSLARGNVDEWLKDVEERMIKGIKGEISNCHKDYEINERKKCLLSHCAMSILTVEMTNWTKDIELSLQQGQIEKAVKTTQSWLTETVELIKDYSLLKKVDIITLESLIVLSVHNLDIVKNLHFKAINSPQDFEWESQLRYYFKEFSDEDQMRTFVKILNATCDFNHEYLGNTTRLVITPLTDRCYRTLCSAIFLNYGGAPEGPAGTGKTETVKDLAKALACQCVVFNCSDGLDYKAMGKFFKGLAASGAWSCFDEFNRINLQVLSVVAQQILSIQAAKAKNQTKLFFEDTEIGLKKSANCFITMNPGYAGRSQLPDNLKALFRSVAMMIPDYAMIAEISLYSYGFSNARNLARKIVSTYKLCSEQLSSQQHYDYGMRAVKSVLVAAGNLKRKNNNLDENALILKAINDVNLAKFLTFDIPLFNGITSDLFKDIECPKINYDILIKKIEEVFEEQNFTLNEYSIEKIIQIYDMILVRHGLMVVGYPFSGKSTALEVLAESLKRCKEQMNEEEVQLCRINPKAITMKQLYGFFDEISHEWFDGVLAVKFRNFASNTNSKRKWLLLDGPVDAVWIENMNTVLDDNKKLCLNSGQIIAMSKSMNLIFEPMDLLAASPATVSRCGMIYMQPESLGHKVLIESWIRQNGWLSLDMLGILKQFFSLVPTLTKQISKNLKTIAYTDQFFLTQTLLRILRIQLEVVKEMLESENFEQLFQNEKFIFSLIGSICTFSIVWSFGGCLDTHSRKSFDLTLKRLITGEIIMVNKKRKVGYSEKGTLFDYNFVIDKSKGTLQWTKWVDLIQEGGKIKKEELDTITVKTSDTMRYDYFINICLSHQIPLILCGPTGTGKTTLIKKYCSRISSKQFSLLEIVFSSRTSCAQVLQQIESKIDKKGAKNILGPKTSNMIIYVDDLNMPLKQKYGAQPPVQFLRQLLDQKGFYDLKEKEKGFKRIIDVIYIYSMASLNNAITPRFLRHINLLSVANFDEDTLLRIFTTILGISFEGHPESKNMVTVLKNSIELYDECLRILRPTPQKSHYIFNLRDLSKLILGICKADKAKVHSENIGRLWGHESSRIFVDRLLPEDKSVVENLINNIGKKWGKNMNKVYFSDILSPSHERIYEEISDLEKVNLTVATSLNNYNMVSDRPMDLVLFNYALEHILIVLRIIRQPKGHALLVGLGGSGRKSFSYLSSFIAEYSQFNLEITKQYGFTHFREDMKKLFIQIGVKNKLVSFIFNDSQIKDEQFLEDINNMLNIGFIPNLFPQEQRIQVCQSIRKDAVAETGADMSIDQLYEFFLNRIKTSLRLILCFSPIGQSFRTRMRMFPSLVNCTTIDWFNEWPQEGLISVARQFLKQVQLPKKQAYIQMFQYLHTNSKKWCEKFYQERKRRFYVTPTSYIEFITTFKQLLTKKKKQVKELIYKYENGYKKIIQTELQVEKMQKSLEEMKPEIRKAAEDTALKMQMVKIQKEEADVIHEQITGEEKIVLQAVTQANLIKEDCEKQLAVAIPQLKAAENALLVLDKSSLTELKSMNNPPIAVRLTLQGLCLLIDPNPKQKIKNEKTLKMETDWWSASNRLLGNPKLLNDLINFNREALSENLINNLGKFLNDPNNKEILTVANVAKSSTACECIIEWVKGIYTFYFVNKKVKPKKESLKIAQEKVQQLNKKLNAKRMELETANSKIEQLNYELEWAQKNKERLEHQYAECEIALKRAQIIMSSLGSQKVRWLDLSNEYKNQNQILNKKVFMATAQLIYFGPFTQSYRQQILKDWLPTFKERRLELQPDYSLIKTLGSPVKIRSWNLNGLPNDNFSVENGLIIYNSRRWPLMIDPQGQANKWLKKEESHRKLRVIKPFEDNFIRNLQNCIQFGTPVLLQNLGEEISAALTPVLLKQTYKKGATTYLKMGENLLIYSQDFFLYMTTKLSNPHYLPQVCTQVVMINFMITEEGLSSQLLALLVSKEKPALEVQKESLVIESADNQKNLLDIENQILDILSNSENILADQTAINVLSASKQKSIEINEKQIIAKETQIQIDKARLEYKQVSEEGSLLFFAVSDLGIIDPMYQYSLVYFTDLYTMAIQKSQKSQNLSERLKNLKQYFRLNLFRNIGRSLFQKDRLMFSVLLALRLIRVRQDILQYIIMNTDSLSRGSSVQKPKDQWITEKLWKDILRLSQINSFENILLMLNEEQNKENFKNLVISSKPFSEKLPSIFENISSSEKLLLYKCFRPDKMVQAFTIFVEQTIGHEFVKSLPFDLSKIYPDSNEQTPILFILSPGSDPFISINNFGKLQNIVIDSISLGQGQGPIAERLIAQNREKGGWVILQNCHLATSWMSNLQKIVEQLEDSQKEVNKNFRMWLTSYPTLQFPQSVLQKSLKITNEPPKGLKNNLMVSYLSDPINDEKYFDSSLFQKPFKKLLYSLTFFHAVIQERRKFGALGWNISYEFNESDLRISCRQLKIYTDNVRKINDLPFKALKYLIAQCNYGGRVTDQNDRRLLLTLLQDYFNKNIITNEKHNFGNSDEFILPIIRDHQQHLDYIDSLPLFGSPQLVGLHQNADITRDINESNLLLESLLKCSSSGGAGKETKSQDQVQELIKAILKEQTFPALFSNENTLKKYPILYEESMNTVLNQQIGRFNRLITQVQKTLRLLSKAIKGEQIMTNDMEKMFRSLYEGKIPDLWMQKSYPSLKPLGSYITDLIERVEFFNSWIQKGIPNQFWLSGFFFTQSFLTGILQNYSRRKKIPVDELVFEYKFKKDEIENCREGANIYGLFIEGAGWNSELQILSQSQPRQLFIKCPNIYLKPEKLDMIKEESFYEAPLYKTLSRRGVLSTTGHSTNFVINVKIPTKESSDHWIKRGVALLTQLSL